MGKARDRAEADRLLRAISGAKKRPVIFKTPELNRKVTEKPSFNGPAKYSAPTAPKQTPVNTKVETVPELVNRTPVNATPPSTEGSGVDYSSVTDISKKKEPKQLTEEEKAAFEAREQAETERLMKYMSGSRSGRSVFSKR